MERVPRRSKRFLSFFSSGAADPNRVGYRRSPRARASVNLARRWFPAWNRIADRVLRLLIFPRLLGFWFCSDFAIDGPGHVSPTLSGKRCFRPDDQINRSPSGTGGPLYVVFSRARDRSCNDQLRGYVCDLLHRCNSVRRDGRSFANSSDALRVLTFVSAAIRSGLQRVGGLHATRIFANVVISGAHAAATDVFIESAAGTAFVSCLK